MNKLVDKFQKNDVYAEFDEYKTDEKLISEELMQSPEKRTVLALLDLYGKLEVSEKDRAARLDVIHRVNEQLEICEKDRAARLDVISKLDAQVKELMRPRGG